MDSILLARSLTGTGRGIVRRSLLLGIAVAGAMCLTGGCEKPTGSSAAGTHGDQHDGVHVADEEHAPAHVDSAAIELSDQALKNIGYEPFAVTLGNYDRQISLPGMIVERPGKSQIRVSAPLTGIVTRSYVIQGEAVAPDSPLFDLRLTHEELVSAQGVFLESAESLDVVNAEIRRLEAVTEGVIAGKFILEQKYERQKLEARMRAQRQGLLLHGLSDSQIDNILESRQLLQSLTMHAPGHDCPTCHSDHPFHIQSLIAQVGQQVTAGDTLAVLADHCELYIEGTAFEEDGEALRKSLEDQTPLSADILISTKREQALDGLTLLYLANQVDRESRALHFYIRLMNEVVLDREDAAHRFVQWRFKPGQRVEVSVPVEKWTDRLVFPADAVVTEGAEAYVYRQSGDHFDRVPVHIEHRDKKFAVVANDGAVFPGEVVAGHGAFQIHLALKNQAGGGVDPHAGHNH